MKNTTNTNNTVLNKIYKNLIDYVSVIKDEESNLKPIWVSSFIDKCEKQEQDFSYIYKNLREGLILQFGFEMTNEVILPEIIWSNDLASFCE